jgi:hypothetical protein
VLQHLDFMMAQIQEVLAFSSGSSIYDVMIEGGGCLYGPGDKTLVESFLSAYAEHLMLKIAAICSHLPVSSSSPEVGTPQPWLTSQLTPEMVLG